MRKNEFKLLIPDVKLIKGTDSAGNEVMKVRGVASTLARDADGQILIPSGFELDYFLESGFINWHHGTKEAPAAIIGEPISARVENNQFIVEGILYPWSKVAKQVYELAENLEKGGTKRRLGWSIEGKAREKDMIDPSIIKRTFITAVAITPMPKNMETECTVMKGFDDLDYETSELEVEGEIIENILEVERPDGSKICVDTNFNIKIFQVGKLKEENMEIGKALTTESGRALMPESLEGDKLKRDLIIIHKAYEKGMLSPNSFNKIKKALNDQKIKI